jgi:TRAP-type C4-dicarboxylate transport system substrate-binding protein
MPELCIRLGGYQPARSVHTRALHCVADELRRRLGDRIAIELTDDMTAAGRRADELLTMTEGDELDICYFSSSYLAGRVPSLELFDRPFRFADREAAYAALDGAAGRRMTEDVARTTGFRTLEFWDNGFRHISNGRHPIRRPADCAGLRIRTLDNVMHQAFFRRLGFEPMFIDVKDLIAAVADGTVDAQENPLTNILNFDLHRHHRFVSLTAHLFGVALLLVNAARHDGWPVDVQAAVQAAAATATAQQRREAAAEDDLCRQRLTAEGVQFVSGNDLDRAAFERAAGHSRHHRPAPDRNPRTRHIAGETTLIGYASGRRSRPCL